MSLFYRSYMSRFADAIEFKAQLDGAQLDKDELIRNISNHCTQITIDMPSLMGFAIHYAGNCAERGPIEHSCHATSHGFALSLSNLMGNAAPVAITIGNVVYKGKNLYSSTRGSIQNLVQRGFDQSSTIDTHVWLTLSNMQVIDLTIIPTLKAMGIYESPPLMEHKVLCWREDELGDFDFEPILVDNDFFNKVELGEVECR
jgi:hypothetical protein